MQNQSNFRRGVVVPMALAGVLLGGAATAAADLASAPVPPEQNYGAVNYRVGGVGLDEAQAMREISPNYPLTLTFAERAPDGRGMFTAGVAVQIVDAQGTVRLATVAEGPMMLVDLPSGEYTVTAGLDGQNKAQELSLREGEKSKLVFVWPEKNAAG